MIFERAVATLRANDRGGTTIPSPHLYPHQWSWDSAFIAIGLAHVDPPRARLELRSLFSAQWADGRVPHIVFNSAVPPDAYFPGAAFWQPMPASGPPAGITTTGLVQPPVHAIAAAHIVRRTAEHERAEHLRWLYPRLRAWHDYLFEHRRLANGLVATLHPWESGLDNSPAWDSALAAVPTVVAGVDGLPGVAALRRDVRPDNVDQRPTDADYARYLHIVQAYQAVEYAPADLLAMPFCVADPLTNTVLAWAEKELATLATMIGAPPDEHRRRAAQLERAIHDHLYVPSLGCYAALDARTGTHAPVRTVGGLVPLVLDELPRAIRATLLETARGPSFGLGTTDVRGVPSYDLTASDVDRRRYWRGPSWVNTTWLVWTGLRTAGELELAAHLVGDLLTMVEQEGFREYFDPLTGTGLGARDFSWSAALVLDVLAAERGG